MTSASVACIRSAARTARSASSSWATGAPNRATMASPMILSTRPPKASMSGDEVLEAAVDQVLDLLGVPGLGQGGEADEVGEQDRDDAALVAAQPQVLPAVGAEPCARRHVRAAAGAGHQAEIYCRWRPVPPGSRRLVALAGCPRSLCARERGRRTRPRPSPRRHRRAARAVNVVKVYGARRHRGAGPRRRVGQLPGRPLHGDHGPVGLGQVHADALRRRPRLRHRRAGVHRRHRPHRSSTTRPSPGCAASRSGFVFQSFNLVPTLNALENITLPLDLAGRDARRASGSTRSCAPCASATASTTARPSCPAASSSAWPWPGPWPASRRSSSPTSPPATSTRRAGTEILQLHAPGRDRPRARPS